VAVDHIDLQVMPGSIFGFLGPNGAGKSTTIRMLLGLIEPDAGEVRLFGQPLPGCRCDLLRRVGALVETPSLYPHLTGRENLRVTQHLIDAQRGQIDRALEIVRLEEAADRLVREYSMGMKQRLGLALALLGKPDLLILDEPTNGLDPAGMQDMRSLIRRFGEKQGMTVFLSSHLLGEVEQVATHIGIIHQGRLRFQGTLENLHQEMGKQVVLRVDQLESAKALLTGGGWRFRDDGVQGVSVPVTRQSDAAAINGLLVSGGVSVYHLSIEGPSLEDIFLQMTESPAEAR